MDRKNNKSFEVVMGPIQLLMVLGLIVGAFYVGTLKTKVDMLQSGTGAQVAQGGAVQPEQPAQPTTADNVPKPTKDDWVKGDRNATIALIEYSDLECPFCKQFHPTAQKLIEEYEGKVMWVYRHYPLAFHANAQKEAEAAECVGSLGGNDAFWKFIDIIYERTTATGTGIALTQLGPIAKEVGVDQTKFQTCLDSGSMADKVQEQMDGGTAAGINGTPGNVLLNTKTGKTRLIPGAVPLEQLKTEVDALLNG